MSRSAPQNNEGGPEAPYQAFLWWCVRWMAARHIRKHGTGAAFQLVVRAKHPPVRWASHGGSSARGKAHELDLNLRFFSGQLYTDSLPMIGYIALFLKTPLLLWHTAGRTKDIKGLAVTSPILPRFSGTTVNNNSLVAVHSRLSSLP